MHPNVKPILRLLLFVHKMFTNRVSVNVKKVWKNGKKSKTAPQFSEFLERYLFGAILANYRLPERKIEKSLKKRHHWQLLWKDTCWGRSGKNTGFRKEKSKKVRKNQTTSGFSSKILVWSDPMATLTTTLLAVQIQEHGYDWIKEEIGEEWVVSNSI